MMQTAGRRLMIASRSIATPPAVLSKRNDFKLVQQLLNLRRDLRLNRPDDHVLASLASPARFVKHSE